MATVDIPVAYDENPHRVVPILNDVLADLATEEAWSRVLLETPTVAGVESVTGGTMTLRIFVKTRPGEQYAIPREIRERAKAALDAAGVRGPVLAPYAGPET
jgi:small conductance mechanosensitive channel